MIFILRSDPPIRSGLGYNSLMEKDSPDNRRGQEAVKQAIDWTLEGKMADAIPIFEEHLMELSKGSIPDRRVAASAFSYYGLCVATVRRKYGEGIKYCQVSLRSNSMDPEHRTNLALVYLEGNDREQHLDDGFLPGDDLLAAQDDRPHVPALRLEGRLCARAQHGVRVLIAYQQEAVKLL